MGIKNCIRFAFESLTSSVRMLFIYLLVMSSGIVLIAMALTLYEDTRYNEKSTNEVLTSGIDNTGYLIMSDLTTDQKKEVLSKLSEENSGIKAGFIEHFNGSINELKPLAASQSRLRGDSEGGSPLEALVIKNEILSICDVELSDGELYDELPKDCAYIYLGAGFSDIPVGSTYEIETIYGSEVGYSFRELIQQKDNIKNIKLIVKGHFEDKQQYISPEILKTEIGDNICTIDMNDQVVIASDYPIEPSELESFFLYNEDSDSSLYDCMQSTIDNMKSEEDMKITYGTFTDIFDKLEDNQGVMLAYILKLAIMVVLSVIVIQLCVSSITIINNSKRYGIMYANGFSKRDMIYTIVMEAVIRCIMAIMLAVVIGYLGINIVFGSYSDSVELISRVMMVIKKYVLVKTIAVSFIIAIVGAYVPIVIISRQMPVKLIKSLGE